MLFLSDLDQTGNNNMTNNDIILQYFMWHFAEDRKVVTDYD